jgi:hypothetical protein
MTSLTIQSVRITALLCHGRFLGAGISLPSTDGFFFGRRAPLLGGGWRHREWARGLAGPPWFHPESLSQPWLFYE